MLVDILLWFTLLQIKSIPKQKEGKRVKRKNIQNYLMLHVSIAHSSTLHWRFRRKKRKIILINCLCANFWHFSLFSSVKEPKWAEKSPLPCAHWTSGRWTLRATCPELWNRFWRRKSYMRHTERGQSWRSRKFNIFSFFVCLFDEMRKLMRNVRNF